MDDFRRPCAWQGFLFLCALAFLLTACGDPLAQQPQKTPTPLPTPSPIGGLPPGLAGLHPGGTLDPNFRLQLTIGLAINRQGLANDLAAVYDPNSPQFGHYLAPKELADRYGASQAAIDKVTSYLQAHGFQVLGVSPLRNQLTVSASVAQITQTLGVVLQTFQKDGQTIFSPTKTIPLPSALAPLVGWVLGLNNLAQPQPQVSKVTSAESSSDCAQATKYGMTPNQLAVTYGYDAVQQAGYTGKGINIGVVEFNDNVSVGDINHFLSCAGVGVLQRSIVKVDGGAQVTDDGDTGEAVLDLEYLAALAPGAQLIEYQDSYCPGSNTTWDCQKGQKGVPFPEGYVNILNRIAADGRVQLVSASWGNPEENFSDNEMFAFDEAIEYLAAEGITFAAATGDCGAFDAGPFNKLAVQMPAADPYALAVGGTSVVSDDAGNRIFEAVWNSYSKAPDSKTCQNNDWGGGGGLSTFFDQPYWQQGRGVKNHYTNGGRELPDLSANAWTDAEYIQGKWELSGGTSAATPIWVAGLALVDQGLLKQHKRLIGATPTIYRAANHPGKFHPFYDITDGDNLFYPATADYDLASGWGVPNLVDFGKALGAF